MKAHRILLLISMSLFFSCGKDIPNSESTPNPDEYFTLSLKSNLIDFQTSPLSTKSSSSDLYGIQIFDISDLGTNGELTKFACWATNDPSSDNFRLLKSKQYLCCVLYIPDGQNIIETGGCPFIDSDFINVTPPWLDKGILYGSKYGMSYAEFGCAQKKGNKKTYINNLWNDVDIYYGFQTIQSETDVDLNIDMYRMVFGLSIDVKNLKEGYVIIDNMYSTLYDVIVTPDNPAKSVIAEMPGMPWGTNLRKTSYVGGVQHWEILNQDVLKDWEYGDGFKIVYVDKDNVEYNLYTSDPFFKFKRMTNYSFTFDLEEILNECTANINCNISDDKDDWSTVVM